MLLLEIREEVDLRFQAHAFRGAGGEPPRPAGVGTLHSNQPYQRWIQEDQANVLNESVNAATQMITHAMRFDN
jgi:hypothetical protein